MTIVGNDLDTGVITELEDLEDGYTLVIHEDGSDYELGFQVYKEDMPGVSINLGDRVEVEGHGNKYGVTRFSLNGFVVFDRSEREAEIVYEIRKRKREIRLLQEELDTIDD
jgi:hypothetical protein